MDKYLIIATKGRSSECFELLTTLQHQTAALNAIYFVGSDESDVHGLELHPIAKYVRIVVTISPVAGATSQRNVGIQKMLADIDSVNSMRNDDWFVVFFDDDFRPAREWVAQCEQVFAEDRQIVGVTGCVLADGVKGPGLSEDQAKRYLSGELAAQDHWASGPSQREMQALYGCNMAFTSAAMRMFRFDENLPLYSWQEDRDITSQVRKLGKTVFDPRCVGVHLGTKRGRMSGVRLGYSQIANPFYLYRKGTMGGIVAARFALRNLIANLAKSSFNSPFVDHVGRLRGNLLGIWDICRGKSHPTRVLQIGR